MTEAGCTRDLAMLPNEVHYIWIHIPLHTKPSNRYSNHFSLHSWMHRKINYTIQHMELIISFIIGWMHLEQRSITICHIPFHYLMVFAAHPIYSNFCYPNLKPMDITRSPVVIYRCGVFMNLSYNLTMYCSQLTLFQFYTRELVTGDSTVYIMPAGSTYTSP